MVDINGMHADNPESAYDWPLWVRGVVGRSGCAVFLDLKFRDRENDCWWTRLEAECPEAAIVWRGYPDADYYDPDYCNGWVPRWKGRNWYELRPLDQLTAWVDECIWRMSHVRYQRPDGVWDYLPIERQPIMSRRVVLQGSNEKDLRIEGHPLGAYQEWFPDGHMVNHAYVSTQLYREAGLFDLEFMRLFRERAPWAKCLLSAGWYAGGHNHVDLPDGTPAPADGTIPWDVVYPPDHELMVAEVRESILACDVWGTHAYCYGNGAGSLPDAAGYWAGCRELRPAGYDQNVNGKPLQHGLRDPGGFVAQHPRKIFIRGETGTGMHSTPDLTEITLQAIDNMNRSLSQCGTCAGNAVFIWNSSDHIGNNIWPNRQLRERIGSLPRYPRAALPAQGTVVEPPAGEEPMDKVEAQLRDMWKRQGVTGMIAQDGFWAYALKQAKAGKLVIPQPSPDGNWQNHDDPLYATAYTLPPLWAKKGEWVVSEGFAPF